MKHRSSLLLIAVGVFATSGLAACSRQPQASTANGTPTADTTKVGTASDTSVAAAPNGEAAAAPPRAP
jgi:hypothetical protein